MFLYNLSNKNIPCHHKVRGCRRQLQSGKPRPFSFAECTLHCIFTVNFHVHYLIIASQRGIRADKFTSTPFDRGETQGQNGCMTHATLCNIVRPSFCCRSFVNSSPGHPTLHTPSSYSRFCGSPVHGGLVYSQTKYSRTLRGFYLFFIFYFFFFERDRVQMGGGVEGKGEKGSQLGSMLRTEPNAELDPTTPRLQSEWKPDQTLSQLSYRVPLLRAF